MASDDASRSVADETAATVGTAVQVRRVAEA
jgi:hypothetical protein